MMFSGEDVTDVNPLQRLGDKLESWLRAKPYHPTSMANLTNALVAESEQIPAAGFQNLVESLHRKV